MAETCCFIVFSKAPVPGRVNRRLIPALGEAAATELYLELLRRTLATAAAVGGEVQLHATPGCDHPQLQGLAREFGVGLHDQHGRDLGERMSHALHGALEEHPGAVLFGCDIPELNRDDLTTACARLREGMDAVLGPAEDGGYYLVGLSRPCPDLFTGLDWGRDGVLAETRARLGRAGLDWYELPRRWDVDRPADVLRYRERFQTRINLAGK